MKLYKNGALVLTVPDVPAYTETSQTLGSFLGGNYFWGRMDQVRFWKTARTDVEILGSYNCSLSGDEPYLKALYNFSNGVGEGDNPGIINLADQADDCISNAGTLNNFALTGTTSNWVLDSLTLTGSCAGTFPNISIAGNNVCIELSLIHI